MILLGSPNSPYVRKVRIMLEEKGIRCEFVIDRPAEPGSRVPQINPLGKIPTLLLDDGKGVYDSSVIIEYLDGLVSQPRLIPEAFNERIDVKRWEALGDGIAEATVLISHDHRKPQDKQESADWYQKQRLKIERGLAAMARDLGDREFCHGDRFSMADIAAGYALGYLDRVLRDIDWRTLHPNLKRLADRLAARESFRKTAHPAS